MPANLTIRRATQADITALDYLFQRSYARLLAADYAPSVLVMAVPIIGRAQPALLNSGLFHVAEMQGRVVGAGGWSLTPPGGRPGQRGIGHIRHVATDPDAIRQGVGRALLSHIMAEAKASGMTALHCQSTLSAVRFYESLGFVRQGAIRVPLTGGVDFPAEFMIAQL